METPREIKRLGTEGIQIAWKSGETSKLSSRLLRQNCPSADSRAKRGDTSHDKPLAPKKSLLKVIEASVEEELRLIKIWPVGNYAIGIEWGDGHRTGIYTFSYLKELSAQSE